MTASSTRAPASLRETPYVGRLPGNRALNIAEIADLQRSRAAGATVAQLAAQYDVHRRTIYRWLDTSIVVGTVGEWSALFVIRPHSDGRRTPIQVEPWVRA